MRAAILREYGAPPEPGPFDDPEPGDGQELVEVLAAGLNPVDLAIASGTFYAGSPPLPSVVGREGVGRLADGSRVYFDQTVAPYGSFAERSVIAAGSGFAVADGVEDATAVAFGIAGLAAWLSLETVAGLQAGETVLVLGASGSVGLVGVQAAKLLGAGRVVAAGRSLEGLARAEALGADATVALGAEDDLAEAFRAAAGDGGLHVVLDPLWGEPAVAAIAALAPRGRLVNLGQSAGASAEITSASIRGRGIQILGHSNFIAPPEARRAAYERMAGHAAAGELTVDVERVPLSAVADAWRRQREGAHVKLAIVPQG